MNPMRQNLFRILAVMAILGLIGVFIWLVTKPEPTPQDLVNANPVFTYTMKGRITAAHPMMAEWNFEGNDIVQGSPRSENVVKYSVVLHVSRAEDVISTNERIHHSIELPGPGDHTITIVEDSALTLLDLESARDIIRQPVNSTGLRIYPMNLRDWVSDYDVTLFCWEEVGSSGNPEHVCRLF